LPANAATASTARPLYRSTTTASASRPNSWLALPAGKVQAPCGARSDSHSTSAPLCACHSTTWASVCSGFPVSSTGTRQRTCARALRQDSRALSGLFRFIGKNYLYWLRKTPVVQNFRMDKNYSKRIRYEFIFKSGEEFQYQIDIDPQRLEHPAPVGTPPEWARLDVEKCSICPLKSSVSEYCPLALRIA